MKRYIVLLLLLTTCSVAAEAPVAKWQWMAPQRLYGLMKEGSGLWLIDVRDGGAFAAAHIEGAVHAPAGGLATRQFPKQKMLVLVDDALGLQQAKAAADLLAKSGYEKVYILTGGIAAWQGDGHPLAGEGGLPAARKVMPDELAWALKNQVPLQILDLRGEEERKLAGFPEADAVAGKTLEERLHRVKELAKKHEKKGLAGKLEQPATVVLILPTAVDAQGIMVRLQRDLPRDVRYLEGGYAAWAATPDKSLTKTQGGCATCPGGRPGGVK